jgi:glycosyltransferase involved in cell wall biosynthesis
MASIGHNPSKVVFFGTHPACFNGYCKITHNLALELAKKEDIELIVYGFQNFNSNMIHQKEREVPPNVYIYDAFHNEKQKHMGFGFEEVCDFTMNVRPDVCVIYNDMVVVSNIMNKLKEAKAKDATLNFKIIVYIDQVYLYQKSEYVKKLNEEADYVLAFTEYWEGIAKEIGITKPTGFLQHGFNPMVHYPFPKELARKYYSLKKDDFIILNLNRNQPRKRWDICLQAFAEVVSKHVNEPIKLLIATATQGAWNLMEVYERELKKRGLTLEDGMKHLILIDNPQQLTDEDVNILYNLADIGLNTCDGEGFGLCNFEQAAIGIPQVVPRIGGFLDFFNEETALTCEPKYTLYIDSGRDGVGGECQICDWKDYAECIEKLYTDKEFAAKMGKVARENILKNYKWENIGNKFYEILKEVQGVSDSTSIGNKIPLNLIAQWESELINAKSTKEKLNIIVEEKENEDAEVDKPVNIKNIDLKKKKKNKPQPPSVNIRDRLKQKLAQKQEKFDKEAEIKALKEKLDILLSSK